MSVENIVKEITGDSENRFATTKTVTGEETYYYFLMPSKL